MVDSKASFSSSLVPEPEVSMSIAVFDVDVVSASRLS